MTEFSVHDQPDFARVYYEDDMIMIRRGDLRALLDLATGSLDFGSGFWDEEQTEIARKAAVVLGVDPDLVTPYNLGCKYTGKHQWRAVPRGSSLERNGAERVCTNCRETDPKVV